MGRMVHNLGELFQLMQARKAVSDYVAATGAGNAGLEKKYLDDPEYGLTPEKPIFLNGFGAHRAYLDRLRAGSGEPLKYLRISSMPVDGIKGYVDEYVLCRMDETPLLSVYLCLYGNTNSKTAPRGLTLVQ